MAAKQDPNIGRSKVRLAVISMTKMMPVSGARTTAVKNAAIPTTANATGFGAAVANHWWERIPKNRPL